MMLKNIEQALPIHQLHLDHDENRINLDDADTKSDLLEQAICTIEFLLNTGLDTQTAINNTLNCVQFRDDNDLRLKLIKKYKI